MVSYPKSFRTVRTVNRAATVSMMMWSAGMIRQAVLLSAQTWGRPGDLDDVLGDYRPEDFAIVLGNDLSASSVFCSRSAALALVRLCENS